MTKIKLVRVEYIPKALESGILYVSEEFGAAVHLCACGCGMKASTPLGPTGWKLEETWEGASLRPSIGNWQFPCKSHYWIRSSKIVWSDTWTEEQVAVGRQAEDQRRRTYFDTANRKQGGLLRHLWRWIRDLFE